MRAWLLTNTFYGQWLPGDSRGSISSVRDYRRDDPVTTSRVEHSIPTTPWEPESPRLHRAAEAQLKCPPIRLDVPKAESLLEQFLETADHRDWRLRAVAIMFNHLHLVVLVPGDPAPRKILADFKAYGSRRLNERFGKPLARTWWTTSGSKRKLATDADVAAAVDYVLHRQPRPLVVWSAEQGRIV